MRALSSKHHFHVQCLRDDIVVYDKKVTSPCTFHTFLATANKMDTTPKPSMSLFDVYLRLRPPHTSSSDERFLDLDEPSNGVSTHITIKPPVNDFRKRAIEKFGFTRVFDDDTTQLDVFDGADIKECLTGVLGQEGKEGKDGLLATLGVTGSGKVRHRVLGGVMEY